MSQQVAINPANGAVLQSYPIHSEAQVETLVARAHDCFGAWRKTSFDERKAALLRVADIILKNKHGYAALMAKEMGKPLKEGLAELEKCASAAKYFAENAASMLADQQVVTEYRKSFVTFQPIGIILGIMPWNFPFWQVLRYAYPALMAGNVCLLKHASNVPGCALAIESIFREASLPEGAFASLIIPASRVEPLIADARIRAVTLTGSTPAPDCRKLRFM